MSICPEERTYQGASFQSCFAESKELRSENNLG
jgi:hypothetical protein